MRTVETFDANEQTPRRAAHIEQAAIDFYDPNKDPVATANELRSKLEGHYIPQDDEAHKCMSDADLLRMRYRIERGMHQAVSAPLLHMIGVEMGRRILLYITGGRPIADLAACQPDVFDDMLSASDPLVYGWVPINRATAAWSLGTGEAVIQRIEADERHPYRPLLEVYSGIYTEFVKSEQAARKYVRSAGSREVFSNVLAEPASTVQSYLRGPYTDFLPDRGSARELGAVILTKAESIGWGASVSRDMAARIVDSRPAACPYARQQAYKPPSLDNDPNIWVSPLRKGPWRSRAHCPASIPLQPASPDDREVVEMIYAGQQVYAPSPVVRLRERKLGETSAAELYLLYMGFMAIAVAEQSESNSEHAAAVA